MPAESVRELASTATLTPLRDPGAAGPDPGYRPSGEDGGVRAVAGSDVPLARL